MVWKLDRPSRSLKDLLHSLEKIEAAGAGFRSLTEAIDTSGPAGRMMMRMLSSFAEFERAMVRERTKARLKAAPGSAVERATMPDATAEMHSWVDEDVPEAGSVVLGRSRCKTG